MIRSFIILKQVLDLCIEVRYSYIVPRYIAVEW